MRWLRLCFWRLSLRWRIYSVRRQKRAKTQATPAPDNAPPKPPGNKRSAALRLPSDSRLKINPTRASLPMLSVLFWLTACGPKYEVQAPQVVTCLETPPPASPSLDSCEPRDCEALIIEYAGRLHTWAQYAWEVCRAQA